MSKFITSFIVICAMGIPLIFAAPGFSDAVDPSQKPRETELTGAARPRMQIVSIAFKKIADGFVWAKDGRKFQMTSSTKIQNQIHPETKFRIAELVFVNGILRSVTIK